MIRSARFVMRTLKKDEGIAEQVRWLNDPDVTRYIRSRDCLHDEATVRTYVEAHDNINTFLLGIFDIVTGMYVGNHRIECFWPEGSCALGVLIGEKSYWGRGVLTETRAALLDFVFSELDVYKAWGVVAARNFAVVASYQNLGFRCDGIFPGQRIIDGRPMDLVRFGMLRDEWWVSRR